MKNTAIIYEAPYKGESFAILDARIQKNLASYVELGRDLRTVRDNNLYKEEHGTFEDYCETVLKLERRHAYQIMDASEVHENVYLNTQKKLPQTIALTLSVLEPKQQLALAKKITAETSVTEVQEMVAAILPPHPANVSPVLQEAKVLDADGHYSRLHADVMHLYADIPAKERQAMIYAHADQLKEDF